MKIKIGLSVNVCSWEYESRRRSGEHKGRVRVARGIARGVGLHFPLSKSGKLLNGSYFNRACVGQKTIHLTFMSRCLSQSCRFVSEKTVALTMFTSDCLIRQLCS